MIDEYQLLVFPVVVGGGKRLFADGAPPRDFRCAAPAPPRAAPCTSCSPPSRSAAAARTDAR
jgi:dihydrofolate reductase